MGSQDQVRCRLTVHAVTPALAPEVEYLSLVEAKEKNMLIRNLIFILGEENPRDTKLYTLQRINGLFSPVLKILFELEILTTGVTY